MKRTAAIILSLFAGLLVWAFGCVAEPADGSLDPYSLIDLSEYGSAGLIRAEGIDAACRAEAGNIRYDYYLPFDGGDELLLVEKWRDGDALKAHGKMPHMARLAALKAAYVTETVIERYEA